MLLAACPSIHPPSVSLISLRTKIAFFSVVCLGIALVFYLFGDVAGIRIPEMQGALFKVGLVLAAIWLAYPNLQRLPVWLSVGFCLGAILIALHRRLAMVVIPLMIVAWFLRPRNKTAPTRRRTKPSGPQDNRPAQDKRRAQSSSEQGSSQPPAGQATRG